MMRISLDHAATTPARPEVVLEMADLLRAGGNPSAMYGSGRKARQVLERARMTVARCIGADPSEIFFTSGGTESDNWALRCANNSGGILTSQGEHHAVLDTCAHMQAKGTKVSYAALDAQGTVVVSGMEASLGDDVTLVSILHANNEVGTINPIADIAEAAHAHGALMHTDAVASLGKLPVDVNELRVDLLSASAHKFYGPPGIGFLYVRRGTEMHNLLFGGSQEKHRRPGTENVPSAHGMALALELAQAEMEKTAARHRAQTDRLKEDLERIPGMRFCGHPRHRLPGLLHMLLPGIRSEAALIQLDRRGFECAAGAACSQGADGPSHVLLAMGIPPQEAACSLRVSLGRDTSDAQLAQFAAAVSDIVTAHRASM